MRMRRKPCRTRVSIRVLSASSPGPLSPFETDTMTTSPTCRSSKTNPPERDDDIRTFGLDRNASSGVDAAREPPQALGDPGQSLDRRIDLGVAGVIRKAEAQRALNHHGAQSHRDQDVRRLE